MLVVDDAAISKYLKNIFEKGEHAESSVISILEITASDGKFHQCLSRLEKESG